MREDFFKKIPFIIFLAFIIGPMLGKNGIFLVLIGLALFFILKSKNINLDNLFKGKYKNMSQTIDVDAGQFGGKIKKGFTAAVLVVLLLWLFFASIEIIDAGETGVYSLFGRVDDKELRSGFHLVIPLAHVEKMSIRTEEYTMSIVSNEGKRTGDDSITALTKEGLSVGLDLTALYRLNEEKASDVYKNVGVGYDEKIIRPNIRTVIRDVVAGYDAKEMYSSKREEAAARIKDQIQKELDSRGIILEDILLRDVRLPDNLAKSIQEKLQAEQESQKYDFLLDREKKEKERKIIEAEGQRDAQKIINESLTSNYLYYQYISTLKDRQGTIYVPTSPTTGMPMFKELGK